MWGSPVPVRQIAPRPGTGKRARRLHAFLADNAAIASRTSPHVQVFRHWCCCGAKRIRAAGWPRCGGVLRLNRWPERRRRSQAAARGAGVVHQAAASGSRELRAGRSFLRRHGRLLLLLFAGVLLPLWGFAELADEVHEAEAFGFDEPLLGLARSLAHEGFDRWFLLFSGLGYEYGVVPFDIALVLLLAWRRQFRESIFAAAALGGSALLNLATKQVFARARPALWESIAPETSYSFPSGHAMGSMTLAVVLVLLAWRTRWRWPVLAAMGLFVPMVGLSRVYLGVHYPSDILAGWAAASVWAVGCYGLAFRGQLRPWRGRAEIRR